MTRILLVDDEANVLSALQRELRQSLKLPELHIEAYANPFDALNRVCVCDFDIVISDFTMPQMTGGDFLQALREVAPHTVRIMLSASTEFETAMAAINDAQVFRFIPKPWQPADLQRNIRLGLEQRARQLADAGLSPGPYTPPSAQELEARRLENEEPGILTVRRTEDGSIIL